MGIASVETVLDRETLAAPLTAALQHRAATSGTHPLAEAVDLFPAAIVRLKGALHCRSASKIGLIAFGHERWSLPGRGSRVNSETWIDFKANLRARGRARRAGN